MGSHSAAAVISSDIEGVSSIAAPDWAKIEGEYVTGDALYRELGAKYGVSAATICRRAQKCGWQEKRAAYRAQVQQAAEVAYPELAAKRGAETAEHLRQLYESTDKIVHVIERVVADSDQFYRHIVVIKHGHDQDAECRVLEKADTQAIRHLASALKDLVTVLRAIHDIPTVQERHSMEIATKRLQLEVERAKREADQQSEDKSGVIVRIEGKAEEYSV